MAVPISNVVRRIVFAPSGTGPYAFTFEILAATDIEVYKGDTLLTLTTDYTVTINPNGTGSVTLVATAGTDNITIVGARTIQRTTDFVTGGDLFANSLNDELDSLTIFVQQNAEAGDRAIRAPVTDPTTIDMTLPTKTDRAGKYLSFNASTGDPEVVNTVVDITAVANNTANINAVAGQISPVNNISTVAGAATNIATVAGIAANVTTVAGISSNVTTVAGISADVTTVAADGTDIGTVAGLSTEIAALGPIAADITTVAGISADVTAVAGDATDIGTVAGIAANVTTVAGIAANVTTVAGISSDVTTVATNVADITNFSDVYLGPKSSDPATRNDSSALQEGDLYFNTVDDAMKVYDGAAWVAAYITAAGFVTVADAQTITGVKTFTAPPVISVNSASDALRITQVGAGNALVVEDSANPDASPFVIDSTGTAIFGYTSAITLPRPDGGAANTGTLQVVGTTGTSALSIVGYGTTVTTSLGPNIRFARALSSTIGDFTAVQVNNNLGQLLFAGADGTAFVSAARIDAQVDGTPGTNDMPGRLVFSTTADGASTPTERMRIDSAGQVGIGATPAAGQTLRVAKGLTGSTTSRGVIADGVIQSDATASVQYYRSTASTVAASFTASEVIGFQAAQGTIGVGSAITNQFGFQATGSLTGATNNYGFYSNIASGSGRWNFYANGTADNYFAGQVQLGAGTVSAPALSTTGDLNTGIFFPAADTIAFAEGGAEAMRIDSSGNLLVGTTSAGAGAGFSTKLAVDGGNSVDPSIFKWDGGATSAFPIRVWNTATSGDNTFIGFATETAYTGRGSIDYNRGAGLVRYNTSSDATLKNIIGDSDGAKSVEILNSTRIREFTWKNDETQKPQIGVIAQELYETYKGAVSVGGDVEKERDVTEEVEEEYTDENGETQTRTVTKVVGKETYTEYRPWGVDKTAFTFHLVAGWQAHEKLIKQQAETIAALEARIAALETK
jgi:hypothetical protein